MIFKAPEKHHTSQTGKSTEKLTGGGAWSNLPKVPDQEVVLLKKARGEFLLCKVILKSQTSE